MTIQEILSPLQPDLERVEAKLRAAVHSKLRLIPDVFLHTLEAGGKRLRPALALLAGQAVGNVNERTDDVAVAVELVHLASLLHDDVVDEAPFRRGRPTVNRLWGNKVSVLVADYLFATAFHLLSREADAEMFQILSWTVDRMCEGELAQLSYAGSLEVSEAEYRDIIAAKTGALMAAACELGARVAGASHETYTRLHRFGLNLGAAFQMTDDLLDLTGEEAQIGKPVGNDLANGRLTLPLIHTLQRLNGSQRGRFVELVHRGQLTRDEFLFIRRTTAACGGFEYTRQAAQDLITEGQQALADLSPSAARETLRQLAEHVLTRSR